jgi:hypothetical protein
MQIGTKTLLFGNHQFLIYPFFVWLAWIRIHGKLPNWKEMICIFIHDWGYWGKPNVDGPEGEQHPVWAAWWALRHFDPILNRQWTMRYYHLCMFHSSSMAKKCEQKVSKLCMHTGQIRHNNDSNMDADTLWKTDRRDPGVQDLS